MHTRVKIKDDDVLVKYIDIWNKVKEKIGIQFYSNPFYDEKYMKTKVKTFNGVVNTSFSDKNFKRKYLLHLHSSNKCWYVMKINKKNHPQNYLEGKYEIKKKKMVKLIDAELDLNEFNSE